MSFLYRLLARRLGLGFSIRCGSFWFTADYHGLHTGQPEEWEASWSPEDGAFWETMKPSGGWLTKAYERGRGWVPVNDDPVAS